MTRRGRLGVNRFLQWTLPSVLGISAGVVAAVGIGVVHADVSDTERRKNALDATAGEAPSAITPMRDHPDGKPWDEERVAGIERKLATIRGQAATAAAQPEIEARPSRSDAEAEEKRDFQAMLRSHGDEARDPSWSASATASLTSDMEKLAAKKGFRIDDIDCRRTSCAVTLEWDSFHDARTSMATLAHKSYGVNCQRTVFMPHPQSEDERYRATVLFDCAAARASE